MEETFGVEHATVVGLWAELARLESSRPPMSQKAAERKAQNLEKKLEKLQTMTGAHQLRDDR